MDQFSTSIGGLIYLESHPKLKIDKIDRDLGKFVLGDSRQQKDTNIQTRVVRKFFSTEKPIT